MQNVPVIRLSLSLIVGISLLLAAPLQAQEAANSTVTCTDGSTSKAGRGACSHHGGVNKASASATGNATDTTSPASAGQAAATAAAPTSSRTAPASSNAMTKSSGAAASDTSSPTTAGKAAPTAAAPTSSNTAPASHNSMSKSSGAPASDTSSPPPQARPQRRPHRARTQSRGRRPQSAKTARCRTASTIRARVHITVALPSFLTNNVIDVRGPRLDVVATARRPPSPGRAVGDAAGYLARRHCGFARATCRSCEKRGDALRVHAALSSCYHPKRIISVTRPLP